jgi:hypothetical protein
MDQREDLFQGYTSAGSLDFNREKGKLAVSYMLRAAGLILFGLLFVGFARLTHPQMETGIAALINIEIVGVPALVSILLVVIDVAFVLALHELVHAAVFFVDQQAPPKIGIRGLVIYAAAPGYLNSRRAMVINGMAPFTVISLIGLLLIAVTPVSVLSWVFIPVVINAAAAGGDFMIINWLMRQPAQAVFEDTGDTLTVYLPKD